MGYPDAKHTPGSGGRPQPSIGLDVTTLVLLGVGAYLVGISLLMIVAPGTFFSEVGPFGARNDHYIRDAASFQLVLGLAALIAGRRPAWRTPVLALLCVQFTVHAANHLADIDEANPEWLGPADFAGLAVGAALFGALLARGTGPKEARE